MSNIGEKLEKKNRKIIFFEKNRKRKIARRRNNYLKNFKIVVAKNLEESLCLLLRSVGKKENHLQ